MSDVMLHAFKSALAFPLAPGEPRCRQYITVTAPLQAPAAGATQQPSSCCSLHFDERVCCRAASSLTTSCWWLGWELFVCHPFAQQIQATLQALLSPTQACWLRHCRWHQHAASLLNSLSCSALSGNYAEPAAPNSSCSRAASHPPTRCCRCQDSNSTAQHSAVQAMPDSCCACSSALHTACKSHPCRALWCGHSAVAVASALGVQQQVRCWLF